MHHNVLLQQTWSGGGEFSWRGIPCETREDAYELEQDIITDNLNNEKMFNIGTAVVGGDNLTRNPNRTKIIDTMSRRTKDWMDILSEEDRKLLFGRKGPLNGMYGRYHTEETKRKLAERNKGNQYALGARRSTEVRLNLSKIAKERKGEKNPFFQKHHSDKTKKILSEKNKGKKPINCRKVKINGIIFSSITEASRALHIGAPTLLFRIRSKSDQFRGYEYV